jgi:hypothetical protein
MTEIVAEGEEKRGRGRPKLSEEEKQKRVEEAAEARKEKFLKALEEASKVKFKDFAELKASYDTKTANTVDEKVMSDNIQVVRDGNGLALQVHAPDAPGLPQTLEPGNYPILDVGEVTFCKRLGMSYSYFSKYPENDEIIEHMNTLNKGADTTWIVRLVKNQDGEKSVEGILSSRFKGLNTSDLLGLVRPLNPTLSDFFEGDFDKAVDLIDLTFEDQKVGDYSVAMRGRGELLYPLGEKPWCCTSGSPGEVGLH